MLIKRPQDIKPSEITPESTFKQRRGLLKAALAMGLIKAAGASAQEPWPNNPTLTVSNSLSNRSCHCNSK